MPVPLEGPEQFQQYTQQVYPRKDFHSPRGGMKVQDRNTELSEVSVNSSASLTQIWLSQHATLRSKPEPLLMMGLVIALIVLASGAVTCTDSRSSKDRDAKSLAYFTDSYLDAPPVVLDGVADEYSDYSDQLAAFPDGNELSSRARPGRPKPDSPVYYIRLPPTPYMLVPGVGYVSRPPSLRPPPIVQPRPPPPSPFYNLPINFISNGKPTGVYTWKQDSPITHLDKGPYIYNGRPADIFLLRNTYNALYEDALQNFYP